MSSDPKGPHVEGPHDIGPDEEADDDAPPPALARAPLGPPVSTPPEQVVRAALARARSAARARGLRPGDRPRRAVAPAAGTPGPSTSTRVDRALTTETPTPCRPPETA
ncbi:hypothetical protein [Cellulomonas citrea]|uniref:hypothetical protein n=1 Tax=Cellulomonas citrea TaxID=1909423 RepID=UPI001915CC14|nr:hypothetical protein [Cellulomonas citrea]